MVFKKKKITASPSSSCSALPPCLRRAKKPEEEKKEKAPKGDNEKKEKKKTEETKEETRFSLQVSKELEDVITDCKTHKVVVKGEKADPLKVLERVQKKSQRQVELLSPIPRPPAEEPKKPEEKEAVKPEENIIIVNRKKFLFAEEGKTTMDLPQIHCQRMLI
ncbi:PREDICTED: heavy metal-associated isoprenylated plant protein 7-like [Nicotiana attenuata]|uniref:heavy metal-associated isoprenylated plant protein 7-like n=1 Tax=Nicotiana attenuata TaxID=49451 RepID=UPI000904BD3C|nr:PREDICTED: heavy metal-associated isoprenylated plant protein 7-like [Nicotiana attenuata]